MLRNPYFVEHYTDAIASTLTNIASIWQHAVGPDDPTTMAAADRDDEISHLLAVTFNQDAKSLAVGYHGGYMLYNTTDVLDAPVLTREGDSPSPASTQESLIVERLYNSSLVFIVSQKNPRVLHVYHFSSKNVICDHKFMSTVLGVKLNRERLICCCEENIYIYSLKDMKSLHTIHDTPANRLGIMDLSATASSLLAYPGSTTIGNLHIFDAMNLTAVNTFVAHNSPLACLKFNPDGTMLATASSKGTVIRVFSVPNGTKLFEFRRGVSRCVTIYSLAFSADSAYMCSSSNTETVHVFKLEKEDAEKKSEPTTEGSGGWLGYITQTAAAYLPTQMNELITTERSFATAKLPGTDKKNVAALPTINGMPHLLVATTDGFLYCYRLGAHGGECELVKQHRIGPHADYNTSSNRLDSIGSNSGGVPDTDDPDEFPPMSHSSA